MIKFLLIVYFYGTKNYQSIFLFLNSVSNIYYILYYIYYILYIYLYVYIYNFAIGIKFAPLYSNLRPGYKTEFFKTVTLIVVTIP